MNLNTFNPLLNDVQCEHPTLICNPSILNRSCSKFSVVDCNGQVYEYSEPAVMRFKIYPGLFYGKWTYERIHNADFDNYKQYHVVYDDGFEAPLYIAVPCGRCTLCSARKTREWAFRIMCEAQSSPTQPVFITLTYDNENLPEDGYLSKRDVQDFLKRLRYYVKEISPAYHIRYYVCGEYGKQKLRPHYHGILFGLPQMDMHSLNRLIDTAWKQGFVFAKPTDAGGVSYCLKYMRKQKELPEGYPPCFYLSSRRGGGLGIWYVNKYYQFHQDFPEVTQCTIFDKWSGQSKTFPMPAYFKRKIFGTLCTLISKEYRDMFFTLLNNLCAVRDCEVPVRYEFVCPPIPQSVDDLSKLLLGKSFNDAFASLSSLEFRCVSLDQYRSMQNSITSILNWFKVYAVDVDSVKSVLNNADRFVLQQRIESEQFDRDINFNIEREKKLTAKLFASEVL